MVESSHEMCNVDVRPISIVPCFILNDVYSSLHVFRVLRPTKEILVLFCLHAIFGFFLSVFLGLPMQIDLIGGIHGQGSKHGHTYGFDC